MARRRKFNRSRSRKTFRKGVEKQHSKNRWRAWMMRGGIRL